jgi:hypothetical protein
MHFNLQNLIVHQDLQQLDQPITHEEIDEVVKNLHANKALGPDDFNGAFLKKCWPIIKQDIYQLCFDFFHNLGDIQPINNAFITLVPKVNCNTLCYSSPNLFLITVISGLVMHYMP